MLQALIPYIPAAIQGFSTYLGNRTQKKAIENAYQETKKRLESQQALESEFMNKGLDYEQALSNRGIGEDAAATGMTGSSITRRLGDITAARKEAMRKFAFSQMLQRRALDDQKAAQDFKIKEAQKEQMYQSLGRIGGTIASNYLKSSSGIPSTTETAGGTNALSTVAPTVYSLKSVIDKNKQGYYGGGW